MARQCIWWQHSCGFSMDVHGCAHLWRLLRLRLLLLWSRPLHGHRHPVLTLQLLACWRRPRGAPAAGAVGPGVFIVCMGARYAKWTASCIAAHAMFVKATIKPTPRLRTHRLGHMPCLSTFYAFLSCVFSFPVTARLLDRYHHFMQGPYAPAGHAPF